MSRRQVLALLGGGGGSGSVDGVWKVTSGIQAGYRVRDVLFGQSGRRSAAPTT